MAKFTGKQRAFINHYIICLNATEAAKKAGYRGSYDTLRSIGYENLTKPHISAEVERRMKKLTLSADEVLYRISQHATGTMADFLDISDKYGTAISLEKAEREGKLHLLKEYKETETTVKGKDGSEKTTLRREVKLYPADSAHDKIMKYHGLYKAESGWEREIIEALRSGQISPADVAILYPDELARQFFAAAGIDARMVDDSD